MVQFGLNNMSCGRIELPPQPPQPLWAAVLIQLNVFVSRCYWRAFTQIRLFVPRLMHWDPLRVTLTRAFHLSSFAVHFQFVLLLWTVKPAPSSPLLISLIDLLTNV